jgi:membrane complex biogenesis BtpA family protein
VLERGGQTLIGMIHLGHLPGQAGFRGMAPLLERALADLEALQEAGLDAALVENWEDCSPGPFAGPETAAAMATVTRALVDAAQVPVGVNVLPNDYRAAFALVASAGAAFVQVDVLVDPVETDYSHSDAPPFEVRVDVDDLRAWRERLGATQTPLLATIHPKHYRLLEPSSSLEASAAAAQAAGADLVVVTGPLTGQPTTPERLARARAACGVPVLVGSGLTAENAPELLSACDGAIVGTALKTKDFQRVDLDLARRLVFSARQERVDG